MFFTRYPRQLLINFTDSFAGVYIIISYQFYSGGIATYLVKFKKT